MSGTCERCNRLDVIIITQPTKGKGQSLCPECYDKYLDELTIPHDTLRQDADDERKYGRY